MTENYHVVIEHLNWPLVGYMTWASFRDEEHFKNVYRGEASGHQRVVTEGVSLEEAFRLVDERSDFALFSLPGQVSQGTYAVLAGNLNKMAEVLQESLDSLNDVTRKPVTRLIKRVWEKEQLLFKAGKLEGLV